MTRPSRRPIPTPILDCERGLTVAKLTGFDVAALNKALNEKLAECPRGWPVAKLDENGKWVEGTEAEKAAWAAAVAKVKGLDGGGN